MIISVWFAPLWASGLPQLNMQTTSWIWLIIFVFAIAFEMMTANLTSVWFAGGALVALLLSAVGVGTLLQIPSFIIVSIILLVTVGKWSKKIVQPKVTNIDAYIGERVIVLKKADSLYLGEGRFNGLVWSILCIEGQTVEPGDVVRIKAIQGNKLIVQK